MEHRSHERKITITRQDKAYFHSQTYINLEKTDVKRILFGRIYEIHDDILNYQINGTGWYFKEVLSLEIHIVDYKPLKGSSYIPLPDLIMIRKKRFLIQKTKTISVFCGRTKISSSR